jgi:hypothetical protein
MNTDEHGSLTESVLGSAVPGTLICPFYLQDTTPVKTLRPPCKASRMSNTESTSTTPSLRLNRADPPNGKAASAPLQAQFGPRSIGCFPQAPGSNCQMQGLFPDVGESMAVSKVSIAGITIVSIVAPKMLHLRAYVPEFGRRRRVGIFFESVCTGDILPEDAGCQLI